MRFNKKLLGRKSLFEEPLKSSGFSPLDSAQFKWQVLTEKLLLAERKKQRALIYKQWLFEHKESGDYLFNLGKNSTYVEADRLFEPKEVFELDKSRLKDVLETDLSTLIQKTADKFNADVVTYNRVTNLKYCKIENMWNMPPETCTSLTTKIYIKSLMFDLLMVLHSKPVLIALLISYIISTFIKLYVI